MQASSAGCTPALRRRCPRRNRRRRRRDGSAAPGVHSLLAADTSQHRPRRSLVEFRSDVDVVRPRLPPDLRTPRIDVVDVLDVADHLAVCQQLSVVVTAVDTRDDAVDAWPDVNRIVPDTWPEMMTRDVRRG